MRLSMSSTLLRVLFGVLLLLQCAQEAAVAAEPPEPELRSYAGPSLNGARASCQKMKFDSNRVATVFGPQAVQNPNIESVILRVYRDQKGKTTRIVILVFIAGTPPPPTPLNYHTLGAGDADFGELVARLLLSP